MLKQAFAEKRVEELNAAQCEGVHKMVEQYLGTSTKTVDDLNAVIHLIEEAGFDPFAAISADPVEEQDPETEGA